MGTEERIKIFNLFKDLNIFWIPCHSVFTSEKGLICTCSRGAECGEKGKHPATRNGVKNAVSASDSVEGKSLDHFLFARQEDTKSRRNLAICTGENSGVTVLDLDCKENENGVQIFENFCKENGIEIRTLKVRTPSGGMHLFFRYEPRLKNKVRTRTGIDIRNDGGYVIAPPSRHKNGGCYAFDFSDFSGIPPKSREELQTLPEAVLEWLSGGAEKAEEKREEQKKERRKHDDDEIDEEEFFCRSGKYSLAEVRRMLKVIPADDREDWMRIGIVLGREFECHDLAFEAYEEWAGKWEGQKAKGHDERMHDFFYAKSREDSKDGKNLTIGYIIKRAEECGYSAQVSSIYELKDWWYCGQSPAGFYSSLNGKRYSEAHVDESLGKQKLPNGKFVKASIWIRKNQRIEDFISWPGKERIIKNILFRGSEKIHTPGYKVMNRYYAPDIKPLEVHSIEEAAKLARPWIEHVKRLCPLSNAEGNALSDAGQFISFLAHSVQKPGEKVRFCLTIGGDQGTGKDTAVSFAAHGVGDNNTASIGMDALESTFNEYQEKILVRINEMSKISDTDKYRLFEKLKNFISGNPDSMEINPKFGQKYTALNVAHIIITTNHLYDGIYLPPDDRRFDVIETASKKEMGIDEEYFDKLNSWLDLNGEEFGKRAIFTFLNHPDVFNFIAEEEGKKPFNPHSGQRKTEAWKKIVKGNKSTDFWLLDILDKLPSSDFVLSSVILEIQKALCEFNGEQFIPGKWSQRLNNALIRAGYFQIISEGADGRFSYKGKKFQVYSRRGKTFPSGDERQELFGKLISKGSEILQKIKSCREEEELF